MSGHDQHEVCAYCGHGISAHIEGRECARQECDCACFVEPREAPTPRPRRDTGQGARVVIQHRDDQWIRALRAARIPEETIQLVARSLR